MTASRERVALLDGLLRQPQPARWFRLLTAREDLFCALGLLAATAPVELEADQRDLRPALSPEIAQRLEAFGRLAKRYRPYWPTPRPGSRFTRGTSPRSVLDRALTTLAAWSREADPLIRALQEQQSALTELDRFEELLNHWREGVLDLGLLHTRGRVAQGALFSLPLEGPLPLLEGPLMRVVTGTRQRFLVAIGPQAALAALGRQVAELKGRQLTPPPWLTGTPLAALAPLRKALFTCQAELAAGHARLEEVHHRHQLARRLGEVARVEWFFDHLRAVPMTPHFATLTGWTTQRAAEAVNRALAANGLRGMMLHEPPPPGMSPPLTLANPPWARPFELFPRLMGMPGAGEVDPSPLLILLAPLLFGYMFGDVGQGLVLAGAGWLLGRRWPMARLLLPAGLSATLFGWLFGSLFCLEGVIPALWLHPLQHPLPVLAAPLGMGALMVLGGLLLQAREAAWAGQSAYWWGTRGGLLPLYLGLAGWLLHPAGGVLAGLGAGWLLVGGWRHAGGRWGPFLAGLGHLPETLLQLGVNTISFSRVGAFALAHAGLSAAVVELAAMAGGPLGTGMVLLLGNGVILGLEGLVVSIQTTRLILLEFFIRFLQGNGRPFRPLPPLPC